jgi:hypothetical protein
MSGWQRQGRVEPGGDVGGDWQATEAFSVRYTRADRPGAVVDVTFYGEDPGDGKGLRVTAMTETTLCTDVRDPGGTETWSDAMYRSESQRYRTDREAERAARNAAERHQPSEIRWDGRR